VYARQHPRNLYYKIAKNIYQAWFGLKIILSGCEISTQALSIKVCGQAKSRRARVGLVLLRYKYTYSVGLINSADMLAAFRPSVFK
jgi:hypothetical protein